MEKGALNGVVVLDLSRVLAGPYCTMILADMGAEVIKVERPVSGDDSRTFPPVINGESIYYQNMNRNKKGITLNLKTEQGKKILLELAKKADILIENYRPGTMEKLGLGWDVLHENNPRMIYGCVSGFGHTGPYSKRAGYDIVGQAMSGLMSVTGWPGGEPTRAGGPMSDTTAGLTLAVGVLAALHYRDQTGIGQKVDIALVDALVANMQIINQIYLSTGRIPARTGNRYESTYPYDTFPVKGGKSVVIGCANDKFWGILCTLMGREELITDPDMDKNPKRVANHEKIKPIVAEWTKNFESQELIDLLLSKGVPAAPILDISEVSTDPHIAGAREMFPEAELPGIGKMKITGSPFKMSETKPGFRTPAPTLGQNNDEVFGTLLGLSKQEQEALAKEGTI